MRRLTRCLRRWRCRPTRHAHSTARGQDRDDELNAAITREYHFGGEQEDFFTKKAPGAEGEALEEAYKSKKEVRSSVASRATSVLLTRRPGDG